MRNLSVILTAVIVLGFAPLAAAAPIAAGAPLPAIALPPPADADQRAYLGLAADGPFRLTDIRARLIIVEIFSTYCPHCQREAPAVNRLYRRLQETPRYRDAVRLIGIGVGNSADEVDFFKETYDVRFPLFPDADLTVHRLLGEPRTPFFMAVRIGKAGEARLVHTHPGGFDDPAAFLRTIMGRAGLQ